MADNNYGEGKKLPQYIAALSVCMGSVAAGTVLGWTSNIEDLNLEVGAHYDDIYVDTNEKGWIGSFATLGGLLMCLPVGYICDLIGRKLAMLSTIVLFSAGWLLIIFANNVEMLYAGRFLTGMAGGSFCVAAPMYTSEIAESSIRGALGSYFQLLLTVGILFAYLVAPFTKVQVYSIICAIIPLVFGVVFFLQPETPVYLIKKGKIEEAKKSLIRLRGEHYNYDSELNDIKKSIEEEGNMNASFMESIKTRAAKKAMILCFGLMTFQQLSGINAVIFYTGTIFKDAGSSLEPYQSTIIVGVMQVLATFVSSLIIDRFGRKILLLISDFFMMIAALLLGIFFSLKNSLDADTIKDLGFLPIAAMIIFIVAFSLGFGPIPWLASSEIFPPEIKSNASSAAAILNWFLAFLVTKFYINLTEAIGTDATFYIFSAVCACGTCFVYFFLPETKGKSIQQIQDILNGETSKDSSLEGCDNPTFTK